MIDRGDLSLSTSVENITLAQKKIINISNKFSKPVIVATDLLKSMIKSNVPTKKELLGNLEIVAPFAVTGFENATKDALQSLINEFERLKNG